MKLSLQERDRRYKAIREEMAKENIDVLLIAGRDGAFTRGHLRYVTNHGIMGVDLYCLFPAEGEPIFFTWNMPWHNYFDGWISELRFAPGNFEIIMDELPRFDKGNKIGIVGTDIISHSVAQMVEAGYPGRIVDAIGIFKKLRLIKSPEEIAMMRKAAAIADDVFYTIKNTMLKPGVTDFEVIGTAKKIIHDSGCEYSMEFIDAKEALCGLMHPVGNVLEEGGTLLLEMTPSYHGYYSQLTFTLPVGNFPADLKEMFPVWKESLEAGVRALKPGNRACDVYQAIAGVIHKSGFSEVYRCGHGIGLDCNDLWAISPADTTLLQPNMTVILHPGIINEATNHALFSGFTYLITETGSEKFSKISPDEFSDI